ncbi:amidase [Neobacillus drentensis]|uniref:amidase n=1 Tax=Neobacillus drentensis TaxID=220684 RepID=UPI002FFDEFC1
MKKWYELSILEVADLYRKREMSPVDMVRNIFERYQKLEPELNCFITTLETEAFAEAEKAEKIFLQKKAAHILCGIPFSVKDLYDTEGIRTTCGSIILKNHFPKTTAPLVEQLQSYGAILLGKTNMLEFAYGIVHPEYGQTNNPWDVTKTAGGSSGGSAASVAAGLGLFSLGSDTGGSIRIPAAYCGIAGLKPTYGLLSLEGVFPLSPSLDHAGPLARSAEDLLVVMDALVPSLKAQSEREEVVVGILSPSEMKVVAGDVLSVYREVLTQLENLNWRVKAIDLKYFNRTEEIVMNILLPEAALIHEQWHSRQVDYALLTFKQIEAGLNHLSLNYLKAKQEISKAQEDINLVLENVDLLVMPTVSYPAPEEDPPLEEDNEMKFTGIFNVSGHPAVTIQAGFSKEGLPIGIQLVGKLGDDKGLLIKAIQIEKMLRKGNSTKCLRF